MAVLTHLYKHDLASRTTGSAYPVELASYTVAWTALVSAGFAASDDVVVLVTAKVNGSDVTNSNVFTVGVGTSYAARVNIGYSYTSLEPGGSGLWAGEQLLWFDRRTLTANENFYLSGGWATAVHTSQYIDFNFLVLKLSDFLSTNDWGFAEVTHSGAAPASYNTAGAAFTTGADGDWLIFAATKWLINSTATNYLTAINANGVDRSEVRYQGENASNECARGTVTYIPALASGQTIRCRFAAPSADHECVRTAVFGLRLNAFLKHAGARTTNPITHSVLDTFQQATSLSITLDDVGPLLAVGLPIHTTNEPTKAPYGRIQIGNVDWPEVWGTNAPSTRDNGEAQKIGPILIGYNVAQSAGVNVVDFDCAENNDVSPAYNCTEQTAAVFTLTLAGAYIGVPSQSITFGARAPIIKTRDYVTHLYKGDLISRTTASAYPVELANYTILWSDITAAGFIATDDIVIIITVKINASDVTNYGRFAIGFGATYAGRVDEPSSYASLEAGGSGLSSGEQYMWIDRRTLVANENIYFSGGYGGSAVTAQYIDFNCLMLKLSDFRSPDDWAYNEVSP